MKNYLIRFFRGFLLLILSFLLPLETVSAIAHQESIRLIGHIPVKAIKNAVLSKQLDTDMHMPMTFVLPLRNQSELEELIQRIYDPTDQQNYGKYLSSKEFIKRFAPSREDYNAVIEYANKQGFTIVGTHANRLLLNVIAPAASVESAFNLRMQHYQHLNGRKFYAPSDNPEMPSSIASIINGVVGLDNYAKWHSHHIRKEITAKSPDDHTASAAFPSGPDGGFSPQDLIIAYNLGGVSANGSGQVIALFELAGYQASDISAYTNHFGLPAANLKNILVDGGSSSGIDAEVTLDIELALALAPQSQIYVYEGPNSDQGVLDTYNRIAIDNIAKQVSTSWGLGEDLVSAHYLQAENAIFLQMAAHGQTIYAAAGDSGAYDDYQNNSSQTLVVDDPASQPYVVGVGGTSLIVDAATGAYKNEVTWNDGLGQGAGGGGVSKVWSIPSWQSNVASVYSKTNRNVPDVALNADTNTGYSIYYDGQWQIYGGTSCAAPLWAAFTACINQARVSTQKPTLGFANPLLYATGLGSARATNFHDVISGNNLNYSAGVGYDNATGWGSFNGGNLFGTLTNVSTPTPPQLLPILNIAMNSSSSFKQGKTGSYQITVSNIGNASTSGPVTVAINLPSGLSYKSFNGSGWSFNSKTMVFTQNGTLQAGKSYPVITLTVNVQTHTSHSLLAIATASGGGAMSTTVSNTTNVK